ncbi:MAG: recombinase family protein [Eubacteriales bacterium]|nr:recombinase family protein [Eubacteriales bacterium]
MNETIRCACYVRVSTENQLDNFSVEEQIDRLTAYCKAKDYPIVKFYTDGGYSGGNLNRPALQQMLDDINKKYINMVIVYKLDRLSRSQKDTLSLIEDSFLANGVDFISLNENFDTSTPVGRATIGMLSVFAQLEKDQITERFTMGRVGRAKSGHFHGGAYAPVGYDYVDGELVVNEYEALQVNDLYERFVKGYPLHDCWRYMQSKYKTKYGEWSSETLVRNVLKNKVYIGYVQFQKKYYKGVHQPIITEELFQAAQNIFKTAKRDQPSFRRSPFKANTLLSGLIYCGNCGARYHGEHGNYSCYSRTKGDKKQIKDPSCRNKKWKIEELDKIVVEYISALNFDESSKKQRSKPRKKDYSHRISEIERQISNLIDLYQIGSIPMDTISSKIDALSQEKSTLIAKSEPDDQNAPTSTEKLQFKEQFISLLDGGSLQEKRACLANLIDKIIITEEHIEILLK